MIEDAAKDGPLRVLRLSRVPAPGSSGSDAPDAPVSVAKLNARFRDQGLIIDQLDPLGMPWNPFARSHPLLSGIDPVRSLGMLARRRSYDAVIADFESPALVPLLLRGVARFRPPIVMVDIGLSSGWKLRDKILDFVVPRIDGIVALGTIQVDHIKRRWRPRGLVEFVPMHIDTEFYQPFPFQPSQTILTVGDDIGRDFDTLLSAAEGLDAEVVLKTNRPIQERDSHPRVRQIRQRLDWAEYREMFAAARCVVIPVAETIHASGVGSLLEAMAMGKPIVATGSAGLSDYLRHEENALVVPCADPTAMRTAIQRLLTDPDLCVRLGAGARRFVEERCSFAAHGRALKAVLRQVVAKRRSD
jgi:glycosyltransferase involved in cell wall biosynthesis